MSGRIPSYKVGESVMASWQGNKFSYKAKVIRNSGEKYEVEFENGTRRKVDAASITPLSEYKTESSASLRRKSPSRTNKSPSRVKKSPSSERRVTRSRSRSAGRTAKVAPKKASKSRSRSRSPGKMALRGKSESVKQAKQTIRKEVNTVSDPQFAAESEEVRIVEPPTVDNTGSKKGTSSNFRYRNLRTSHPVAPAVRASARIVAMQTNKVAGITDELITEIDNVKQKPARVNGRHFGGAFGTLLLILFLPFIVLGINLMCTKKSCTVTKLPVISQEPSYYFDWTAAFIYLGWFLFQAVLYALPTGRLAEGQTLIDGTRLKYRINGFFSFILSIAAVVGLLHHYNAADLVYSKFVPMLVTSTVLSYVLALLLFIKARWTRPYALAPTGNTGNAIYDFFMGRELNPRIFGFFDIKMFLELRPGIIGWAALNVCFLFKDYNDNGTLSYSLSLSAACQLLYAADALLHEKEILSTMDITTEGLGYMLVLGDLTFVPFFFTLQSRFLLEHKHDLPWYCLAGILLLNLLGHFIFRASNNQKDVFRCNRFHPSVSSLDTISTKLPKEILAGGWWGWLRHPNYFGDLLMALAWCLPCGFNHLLPYSYFIYLFTLLCHRSIRDDEFCRRKYGGSWDEYCRRVRHRIFPKIF